MNETSHGLRPRLAHAIGGATLFAGFVTTLAGCPGPSPMSGNGGSGGDGSTSSTSSSSSTTTSSSSSTSSSTTSSSSSSSSTGGIPCTSADECPVPTTLCSLAVCKNNVCIEKPATLGTKCTDNNGQVCDGAGVCVECVGDDNCENPVTTPCEGGKYTPPPACSSNKCVPGVPVDCSTSNLICSPTGCVPCTSDGECGPNTTGGCSKNACLAGACGAVQASQGTACLLGGGNGVCDGGGACAAARYVFVTAAAFNANFGNTMMADKTCQTAADAAGLGGTWLSWTSDSQSSPTTRFTKSLVPYKRLDESIVANNFTELALGQLAHAIDIAEDKSTQSQVPVWTGTKATGIHTGASCGNWALTSTSSMGTVGFAGSTSAEWTNSKTLACNNTAHLYCFQQ